MTGHWVSLSMILAAMVQSNLPRWALLGSLDWPILTMVLMMLIVHIGLGWVIYASVWAGVLYDVFSPAPLGISLPYFLALGMGLYALKSKLFSEHLLAYSVLGLAAVSLKTVWFFMVFSLTGLRPLDWGLFAMRLLGGLLLGLLSALPVYWLSALARRVSMSRRWRK